MGNIDYFFARLIRFTILFFILYLIFTNFGTFLIVISVFALLVFFFIYTKVKKIKEQARTQGFEFHFDGRNFRQGNNQGFKFNYEDFQKGNFQAQPSHNEVQKAKDFFGFTSDPTREEIKKRYKELAKKYHPDINDHGDDLMQELNHHKDVLLNIYK